MKTLFLDYETYYCSKSKYSLRSLTTIEYVRDPRFHVHMLAYAWDDEPPQVTDDPASVLHNLEDTKIVAHNTMFDGLITVERFNARPAMWGDTQAMARALFRELSSHALDYLGEKLLGERKVAGALESIDGVNRLSPAQFDALTPYAMQDVELMRKLYRLMQPHIPPKELQLIHITTRGSVEGRALIDVPRAKKALSHFERERTDTMKAAGVAQTVLNSNPQFAAHLESLGIEPPTKISKTTGEPTFALAANDLEFREVIAAHPEHQALWDARLAAKSTIRTTRLKRMIHVGETGPMLFPLNYWGAVSSRFSGKEKLNVQNLTRVNPRKPMEGEMRQIIMAPPGYLFLVGDSGQIELRINAYLSGQQDTLDILRAGECVYIDAAERHFGYTVERGMPERDFGKLLELGLGYQMGWRTFRITCAVGPMGMEPLFLTDEEAQRAVYGYRESRPFITANWQLWQTIIPNMARKGFEYEHKGITAHYQGVRLPNGMSIQYPGLQASEDGWIYGPLDNPKMITNLYGGKIVENITQGTARVVVTDQLLEVDELPDVVVVSSTHDEIIALVKEEVAEARADEMRRIMTTPPAWAPDLPLDADVYVSDRYK